jgi:predicted NBD/HSP70 family sugar kinase
MGETRGERIEIVQKEVMPTDRPVYDMIEALFVCAERMLGTQGMAELEGIGISCGGPLSSKRGMILSPPNLPGWDNIPVVKMAEERFGKRTLLQNDANACAMAEWKFGAGMGYSNVIFLTFGTGMGAGLILDGRLYSGTTDLAGEVGHLRLSEMGPVGFGKAGSFEGWASGGGIAQLAQIMVRAKLQMGEKVSFCAGLGELHLLTAKVVAEAAYGGDPLAIEIYAHRCVEPGDHHPGKHLWPGAAVDRGCYACGDRCGGVGGFEYGLPDRIGGVGRKHRGHGGIDAGGFYWCGIRSCIWGFFRPPFIKRKWLITSGGRTRSGCRWTAGRPIPSPTGYSGPPP